MTDTQLAKKLNFKQRRVLFPNFDYVLDVIMGDIKNLEKYVRWKFEDKDFRLDNFTKLGYTMVRDGFCPIMWLPRMPKTPREIATMAHEASHVAMHLYDHIGMKWTADTDEFGAYTIGHIVRSVLQDPKKVV